MVNCLTPPLLETYAGMFRRPMKELVEAMLIIFPLPFQHHLASQLAHKENALDVDPHNAIPSVLGELLGGAAILKSGTVDQNIQPSTQS